MLDNDIKVNPLPNESLLRYEAQLMFTAIDQYSLVLNCKRVELNLISGHILLPISLYYIRLL